MLTLDTHLDTPANLELGGFDITARHGGVQGFEDARDYPKITAALLRAGYSRDDIQKVLSGNVLRLLRAAEAATQ